MCVFFFIHLLYELIFQCYGALDSTFFFIKIEIDVFSFTFGSNGDKSIAYDQNTFIFDLITENIVTAKDSYTETVHNHIHYDVIDFHCENIVNMSAHSFSGNFCHEPNWTFVVRSIRKCGTNSFDELSAMFLNHWIIQKTQTEIKMYQTVNDSEKKLAIFEVKMPVTLYQNHIH